jgi:hypothetical protein
LPQEIQMARTTMPVGTQPVRIEMVNSAGLVVDAINEVVTIRPGQRNFIIKHWVAPVLAQPTATAILYKAKI